MVIIANEWNGIYFFTLKLLFAVEGGTIIFIC